MRILLVVPPVPAPATGNERSSLRLAAGLERRGHAVAVVPANERERLIETATRLRPDVVHVYHAFRAANGLVLGASAPRPLRVVTFAGSDLPGRPPELLARAAIAAEVALADAATVALEAQRRAVAAQWPELAGRVHVVPKGVAAPGGNFPLRERASFRGGERIALLAAGIRPAKRNLLAVEWSADVARAEPRARLVLLGEPLDESYASSVRRALSTAAHALWLGSTAADAIGGAMRAADLVVNVSEYEGQSNALLEAMALGRPVLAADVPGNHEWLRDGENALLFADRESFTERALRALRGGPAIDALAARGRAFVERHHSPEAELDALLELYAKAPRREP